MACVLERKRERERECVFVYQRHRKGERKDRSCFSHKISIIKTHLVRAARYIWCVLERERESVCVCVRETLIKGERRDRS